jgi:hypothetical protein
MFTREEKPNWVLGYTLFHPTYYGISHADRPFQDCTMIELIATVVWRVSIQFRVEVGEFNV